MTRRDMKGLRLIERNSPHTWVGCVQANQKRKAADATAFLPFIPPPCGAGWG